MTLGLVLVAIGFFVGFIRFRDDGAPGRRTSAGSIQLAFYVVGWALVLYFGLKVLLAPHGVVLP